MVIMLIVAGLTVTVVVDMGRIKWPRPSGKENKIQLHLVWLEIKG